MKPYTLSVSMSLDVAQRFLIEFTNPNMHYVFACTEEQEKLALVHLSLEN